MSSEQISLHLKHYYSSSFPYYDKIVMIMLFLKQIEMHQKTLLTYINPATICQATISAVQPPSSLIQPLNMISSKQHSYPLCISSLQPPPLIFQQGCTWPDPTTSDLSTLLLKSTKFPPESETYALSENYESHLYCALCPYTFLHCHPKSIQQSRLYLTYHGIYHPGLHLFQAAHCLEALDPTHILKHHFTNHLTSHLFCTRLLQTQIPQIYL